MKDRRYINFALLLLVLTTLPCFTACKKGSGIPTEYVEGVVRLNGTPLEAAQVTFTPVDRAAGMTAIGFSDAAGIYKLTASIGDAGEGTLVGDYIVTIKKVEWITKKRMVAGEEQEIPIKDVSAVPQSYTSEKTTPLKATVVKGDNKLDFELEGTP